MIGIRNYLIGFGLILALESTGADKPFVIRVADSETGRGVPLVQLTTVNNISYYTDNAGIVAFDEPGLMDQKVYFGITSHGYEYPKDGFGYRGKRFQIRPGGKTEIKLKRINIAERLYRITGAGLFHHSIRADLPVPVKKPSLNAQVFGSDSTQNAVYQDHLFWVWGDTSRASYPLGNFQVTMATSRLLGSGGLSPDIGVDLTYFENENGFTKKMAPLPGKGPTWLDALVTVKDKQGREHLVATYAKIKPPLTVYEQGLCEFNDEKNEFENVMTFPDKAGLIPGGHAFRRKVDGRNWIYFGWGHPTLRMPDAYESWIDPSSYEPLTTDEILADTKGKSVNYHRGHVTWNAWRKCWIDIFTEKGGSSSLLGETWYAEAPAPEGPWRTAVKILTHDKYTFYNPKQHPYWASEKGRVIYFEGTYTATFSGNRNKTPRYDYNQILYRLDLADPRLKPAQKQP